MKISLPFVAVASVIICAGSGSAFLADRSMRKSAATARRWGVPTTEIVLPANRPSDKTLRMSSEEFAKAEIGSNDVVVFSKSYCPFCSSTKALFQDMGVNAKVFELDQMKDGADIQAALLEMTGQRTVPNVFIKGEHLGGNDDTQAAARSGQLKEKLGLK